MCRQPLTRTLPWRAIELELYILDAESHADSTLSRFRLPGLEYHS